MRRQESRDRSVEAEYRSSSRACKAASAADGVLAAAMAMLIHPRRGRTWAAGETAEHPDGGEPRALTIEVGGRMRRCLAAVVADTGAPMPRFFTMVSPGGKIEVW